MAAQLPSTHVPASLTNQFSFQREPISSLAVHGRESIRRFEPSVEHYAAWMSGVGAAVALGDVEGRGLYNDVCLTDPRTNTVTLSPAAGTGDRFRPFTLEPQPLPYSWTTMAPIGCLPGDFNEDGRTDFLVYYWGRSPVLFLRKPGTAPGAAAYTRQELVSPMQRWYTDTVDQADVDGDGHADLIIGNYFPDGARLLDPSARNDPAMHMNQGFSHAQNGGQDRIFLSSGAHDGSVSFREVKPNPLPNGGHAWTLAIGANDLTGSLLPDLYVANDFGHDWLLYNHSTPGHVRLTPDTGHYSFSTPKSMTLGHDSYKGMSVDFGDLTGNGRTDIFVGNISSQLGLMETNMAWLNRGDDVKQMRRGIAPFNDRAESMGLARSGWTWDAKLGDFNNSGSQQLIQTAGFVKGKTNLWPQITELAMSGDPLSTNPDYWPNMPAGTDLSGRQGVRFFVQATPGHWADVAPSVGVHEPMPTRGVATADLTGDGFLDFAIADQWGTSHVYLNRCVPAAGRLSCGYSSRSTTDAAAG